jgi:hypothetical protein
MHIRFSVSALALCCSLSSAADELASEEQAEKQWLAGDHHVHSRFSRGPDRSVDPPVMRIGLHGTYTIPKNATMASQYGLDWMVTTDHGGRDHAKINLEQAYPELLQARHDLPNLIHFFGFEINAPGADHTSIIVPHTDDEAERIYQIESRFDKNDASPDETDADTPEKMLAALAEMRSFPELPIVIANHASRRARGGAKFGLTPPSTLRTWNNAAPEIAIGMAGAPGRQASTLNPDGTLDLGDYRGQYRGQPTLGGFDILTAELGGFWDSMLGEGRHWWVTANSDSHQNWRDGGLDFWPGEFSKTYIYANKNPEDIFSAFRKGKVFVTTGDLVSELFLTVTTASGATAEIGGTLNGRPGETVTITIRLLDPDGQNHHGDVPTVSRVDLIIGDVSGIQDDLDLHENQSTRVLRRFTAADWSRDGEVLTMSQQLPVNGNLYIRVRGTNTNQPEPSPDIGGENPWADLWFYSNPVFVSVD